MDDTRIDSQDERLLSVETSLREVAYKTGQIEARQEALAKSIDDQSVLLASKLDEGFDAVRKGQEATTVSQQAFELRLKPIEEKHLRVEGRIQFLKKLTMPALVATAGVFGAKFGNELINAVLNLFK